VLVEHREAVLQPYQLLDQTAVDPQSQSQLQPQP